MAYLCNEETASPDSYARLRSFDPATAGRKVLVDVVDSPNKYTFRGIDAHKLAYQPFENMSSGEFFMIVGLWADKNPAKTPYEID